MLGARKRAEEGVRKSRNSWFGKVKGIFQRGGLEDEAWEELEELLISADLGVATTEKLLEVVRRRVGREGARTPDEAMAILKEEMVGLLRNGGATESMFANGKAPMVILVVGVNGAGKTTSIAKLARMYLEKGRKPILAAADTFRAAAVEQLQSWGRSIGVDVIAQEAGGDPGAVVFDALYAASSRGSDVVIIDTAGRLHTKFNLMEELKKIRRVISGQKREHREYVLLVLDATTGQNGLYQARQFTEAVSCDGIFLAKLDGAAKGGIVFAISQELGLPVVFVGTGEGPEDVVSFLPEEFVEALFASR